MEKKSFLKSRGADVLLVLALALLTLIQIKRAPLGLDRCDECFYLTVPYRFLQGDVPIVHEWHVSQLSGVLLVPVMWAYKLFGGTGEGIILNFRYIYAAFQSLTAIVIYLLLRRKSKWGALAAALVFLPFSPYYIMALSYNSMCIGLVTLAGFALARDDEGANSLVAAGILFAGAVLCCPYLMLLYLGWGIVILICTIIKKRGELRRFLLFTLGAAAVAAVFVAYILTKTGVGDIIKALPGIFADPEHPPVMLINQTLLYFKHLLVSRKISLVTSAAAFAIIAAALADKNRKEHRRVYIIAASVVTAAFLAVNLLRYNYINHFMLPVTILGAVCYATDEARDKKVFRYVYLTGWVCSYLWIISSNNFYATLTAALTPAAVAGAYFAGKCAEELLSGKTKERIAAVFAAAPVLLLCVILVMCKNSVAKDSYRNFGTVPTEILNCEISEGPAKGLITYDSECAVYNRILADAAPALEAEGENVLYLTHDCWLYLMDEKRASGYSGWLSLDYEPSTYQRLRSYWELNPEKLPDVLYIERSLREYQPLMEEFENRGYTKTEVPTAIILNKNLA